MAELYKTKRRSRNFSFEGGKFKLGREDEKVEYGPQPEPSALEKSGFTNKDPQKDAQKLDRNAKQEEMSANVAAGKDANAPTMDADGNIALNGANQAPGAQEEANPLDFASDPLATQQFLKDQGVKIDVDGKWGPGSQRALNDYYNANPDVEPPFATELDNTFKDLGINQKSYVGKTNYHINGKPVDYKRGEVSSGGEVSPILVESVKNELPALKEGIPGLRITGGNDAYHHSDEYYARRTKKHRTRRNDSKFKNMSTLEAAKWGRKNLKPSGHTDGKSMDFATTDPDAARQSFIDNGFKKVKSGGHIYYKKGNITIIDEYAGKTSGASGGHFHWGVKGSHKGHKH